jgi:hypothetical protein
MSLLSVVKDLSWTTAGQNRLEGAFKIGIRPHIGLRLQAEVSVERIAGSEQNRDLLPIRYTLFATRYNLILQPSAYLCPLKLYFGQV